MRRAAARGLTLPSKLQTALEQVAESGAPDGEPDESGRTIAMRQREGKEGGGKGNLLSDELSLSLVGSSDQLLFIGASLDQENTDDEIDDDDWQGTLFAVEPELQQTHNINDLAEKDIVGALSARDFKGIGNQYVMENKLVVQDKSTNQEIK